MAQIEEVMMDQGSRDELMEALAERLPKVVFKNDEMEMLLTDEAEGTVEAMRIVSMIEAHKTGKDMQVASQTFKVKYVEAMSISERMNRCIAAFKYIHEWKTLNRFTRHAPPGGKVDRGKLD